MPPIGPARSITHFFHKFCVFYVLICSSIQFQVKSDFIDALSSAEKQVQDYQSKLLDINENFTKSGCYLLLSSSSSSLLSFNNNNNYLIILILLLFNGDVEGERKKFRDKLLQTEQQLAAAKGREHALQQQLLKEVNVNQERFKKQLESQANLEVYNPNASFFLLFFKRIFFK